MRPQGTSNATCNLMLLGYETPGVLWGWTREYARKP
jgi:hypothetical protein